MRTPLLCGVVALIGCVQPGFRVGLPPVDRHSHDVRNALNSIVPGAIEQTLRATAPPGCTPEFRGRCCSGTSGEQEWFVDVRYSLADGTAAPVEAEHFHRAMLSVRDAALPAVRLDGVHPITLPTIPASGSLIGRGGTHHGKSPVFLVQYFRCDMAVEGEVVGFATPSPTYPGFTRLTVVTSEWCTK